MAVTRARGLAARLGLALGVALAAPAVARAQGAAGAEVELDKSAAAELYVRRRPPTPAAPALPRVLAERLARKEKEADARRTEAIALLRAFLETNPSGDGRAEGLFKLAELLWEDARRGYVRALETYERAVEACRQNVARCDAPPKEPGLDLREPERLYKTILADHPGFRRLDLVVYLTGFAIREDGRVEEARGYFQRIIDQHPASPLYPDAWLMIAEDRFATGDWARAREAYLEVLARPQAQAADLALFKTAWCEWKLGDTRSAATRFKRVLDLAAEAERSGDERQRRRRAQLRDEALDYLVVVFSEDESVAPKDVYDFLASIGGEQYSEAILVRLGTTFFDQAAYERAIAAWRYLIELDPDRLAAATYQRRIVDAELAALDGDGALAELKTLVEGYGPRAAWSKRQAAHAQALRGHHDGIEELTRRMAKGFHAEAQQREKARRRPDLDLYTRAASTYAFYLGHFGKHKNAAEVRFLRAEILFFKLGKFEDAGDEYLAVGKTAPVGPNHKDALKKAIAAFKRARPAGAGRELTAVDKKFAESLDLYATLFPADPEIVGIIFENGQLAYDRGQYDEAIKRFGVIVTRYPDDPNAAAAGDRILSALNKAQDYENIETWARKLKQARAFQAADEQARLDRLIIESIAKSGEKYGAAGDHARAASFYLRVPKEFPGHPLAAQATFNAAVMLEKAKRPEEAATQYLVVAEKYPKHELAEKAAMTAARVYEAVAYFEQAATSYELVATRFPAGASAADALFNAGVLRQALGQWPRAIEHYQRYAKKYRRTKDDAGEVAFRVGVVYEEAGDDGRAEQAFAAYLKAYRGGAHEVEALTRAGRTALRLGHARRAADRLKDAIALWKRSAGAQKKADTRWAAEARYLEGELLYKEYQRVSLDVKPSQLDRALARKMKLLDEASVLYLEVVEYGDAQWGTAALYRIGAVMEEFARSLRDAPVPASLSEADKQLYREALDNEVINVEEKAIELYTVGYQKALGLKVFNQYTKKIREALGRLAASQYPPMKEAREGLRIGDRVPEPALIEEVVR